MKEKHTPEDTHHLAIKMLRWSIAIIVSSLLIFGVINLADVIIFGFFFMIIDIMIDFFILDKVD